MPKSLWWPKDSAMWPYDDLQLRTYFCPWCGSIPEVVVGPLIHPMAWCVNDVCQVVMFDPSRTAKENVEGAMPIGEHVVSVADDGPSTPV